MADLTIASVIDTFLAATTAATARQALGIYLTQAASSTLTQAGGHGVTFTTTGTTSLTLPTSGTLLSTASTLAVFAATTSSQLAGVISDETGSGALVFATSPTMVTPVLGAATATSINGVTITSSTGVLTIASGKTLTASNTLTFTGTDGTSWAFPATGGSVYTSVSGSITSAQLRGSLTDETGTGSAVFATSPTLVTPALGTPSSGTLTNCTGLPCSSGLSGLGTGIATFLATPSSANLRAAITDETGSGGALVFATAPTLTTPEIGAATGTSLVTTGAIISSGATQGIGYTSNAGGTVTQITSATTGVTLNKICGQIITVAQNIAAEADVEFTVTNSTVTSMDVPWPCIQSGSNGGNTAVSIASVANGSFVVRIANNNAAAGTAETGTIYLNFAIVKAVNS